MPAPSSLAKQQTTRPPSVAVSRLLALRLRALRRRLSGGGTLAGAMSLALAVAAAAAVSVAIDALAAADLLAADGPGGLRKTVSDRAFWLNALPVLVYAYTTWEVAFRASDARFVALLPLPGDRRWIDLLARSATGHLPLLIPAVAYAAGLATRGAPEPAAHVLGVAVGTYLVAIPMCSWLHLTAGRSMLGGATPLKKMLASQVVDDDAALILYAPAGGLAIALGVGLALDIAMKTALWAEPAPEVAVIAVGLAAVAGFGFARAGMLAAAGDLPLVVAKLREVDSPMPYRDDGIPETTSGEGLAARLPRPARPFYARDLKQLRRRHRLDRILLWVFGAVALRLGMTGGYGEGAEGIADALCLLGGFVGLLLVGGWRIHGAELGSAWLSRSLPAKPGAALIGGIVADLIIPTWALLWMALGLVLGGHGAQAATTVAIGAPLVISLVSVARFAAATVSADRVGGAALAWRAALVVGIAVTQWQIS